MSVDRGADTFAENQTPRIEGDAPTDAMMFGLSQLGTSGLKETGGWIYEEFLPQLAGSRGVKLYAEMEKNSATIGAIRKLIRDLVRQVEWSVNASEEAKDEIGARRAARFVDGCRNDMEHTWADLISEAITMVEYGFAPCVITYKLRRGPDQPPEFNSKFMDGKIGWRSIELRAQDTLDHWEFDPDTRKLRGMWQSDFYGKNIGTVFIPVERLVNFRTESTKNNPEGRPLFRNAVVPYLRLKHVETVEMIGVERDLTGLPIMEVPLGILKANTTDTTAIAIRNSLEKQLASLKMHERMYLLMPPEIGVDGKPTGYKFRLQQGAGTRQLDVVAIKNSYKTDIFQSCLAQFLQLGQNANAGGNRALSSDQTDLFSLALYSLLESIRETFQRSCIDRLCALNSIPVDQIPQLSFGDIDTPNLAAIGSYITALNGAGVFTPDEEVEKHLYKIAGLPWARPTHDPLEVIPADELIGMARNGEDLSILTGESTGAKPAESNVKTEILNGAQLASLIQVVQSMADGLLPKDSAASILQSSLGMDPGTVESVLGPVQAKLDSGVPMPSAPSAFGGKPAFGGAPKAPAQPADAAPDAPVKSADDLIAEVLPSAAPGDEG